MEVRNDLIAYLFRREFAKMVAVISRKFGLQHIEIAEDIVSDTFLVATESWNKNGVPANPTAWLYLVARQKAFHHFRRTQVFANKIIPALKDSEHSLVEIEEIEFSNENIRDSELQMMFAICNPAIASEAQIGLALRILCGFGIDEIAEAFLTSKETINKRLFRAKEKLRTEKIKMEFPADWQINARLDNVLHIIYLLFNEGYCSSTQNQSLRKDFCLEALRLAKQLTEVEITNQPKTNALIALMCFHTSRFDARQTDSNHFILYDNQDKSLWNEDLIHQGGMYLGHAAQGEELSSYHLEAGIAFWHSIKEDTIFKWENILCHYDLLLQLNYSPMVALSRIYAVCKVKGNTEALIEAEKLNLTSNHFYFTLLGELYTGIDNCKAKNMFLSALGLAKSQIDQMTIRHKIDRLSRQ